MASCCHSFTVGSVILFLKTVSDSKDMPIGVSPVRSRKVCFAQSNDAPKALMTKGNTKRVSKETQIPLRRQSESPFRSLH